MQALKLLIEIEKNYTFIDSRDNMQYKAVKIGGQIWMAENLDYFTSNSYCYDDKISNCSTYGRLYTYDAAKNACPPGWYLPSDAEWTILINYLGGKDAAGKLKSTSNWTSPNTGGTNSCGFTALPGGGRAGNGTFYFIRDFGCWWSSTESSTGSAWIRQMGYKCGDDVCRDEYKKTSSFSVRCVKYNTP